jgi:hypothetical protein
MQSLHIPTLFAFPGYSSHRTKPPLVLDAISMIGYRSEEIEE